MSDDENNTEIAETNGGDGEKIEGGRLSQVNRYFEVLSDPHRRHALYYLDDHRGEAITIDELARHVKAQESEYSADTLVEDDFADVRRELYHNHLPRLADYGIINYDSRRGDVRFHHPSRVLSILLWVSHLIERPP